MATDEEQIAIRNAVADELRAAIARADLTQDEVAEATGLHRVTINRLLGGERSIKVEQLILFGEVLDFDPGELLDQAGKRYLQKRARKKADPNGGSDN